MKYLPFSRTLLSLAQRHIALLCLSFVAAPAYAQSPSPAAKPAAANATVPVLLISDIHFEAFWDPDKVPKLNAANVSRWDSILAPPASPGRDKTFKAFIKKCHCSQGDTSSVLLDASLKNMGLDATGAAFVTVSGDLVSHDFDKKYSTAFPGSTRAQFRAFVEKTIEYVVGKLYARFPGVPVYVALGNNDTDCRDYWLDANSDFLKDTGLVVAKNFPTADKKNAEDTFAKGGYYSVALPAPIQNARLLVLDDLFMANDYKTCAGNPDQSEAVSETGWLAKRLAEARASKKQKIWVMGHIPPGVDPYSTSKIMSSVCSGSLPPVMFQSSENMADAMTGYGDVIQLAIFAHTHMDELRLLKDNGQTPPSQPPISLKMVSSISPIHDNLPSITLAKIDPSTAAVVDYQVFSSPDLTGDNDKWTEGYAFDKSYLLPDFSSSSLAKLIAVFAADPGGTSQDSIDYIADYSAGNDSSFLQTFWPQYVCSLSNHTATAFTTCACSNAH